LFHMPWNIFHSNLLQVWDMMVYKVRLFRRKLFFVKKCLQRNNFTGKNCAKKEKINNVYNGGL